MVGIGSGEESMAGLLLFWLLPSRDRTPSACDPNYDLLPVLVFTHAGLRLRAVDWSYMGFVFEVGMGTVGRVAKLSYVCSMYVGLELPLRRQNWS
jgi:hypothetical protein